MRACRHFIGLCVPGALLALLLVPLAAQDATGRKDIVAIGGLVRDRRTDAPIAGVLVTALRHAPGQQPERIGEPMLTGVDGRWSFAVPRPSHGRHGVSIRFRSRTYGSVETRPIRSIVHAARELPPVSLAPGVRLSGIFRDIDEDPRLLQEARFLCVDASSAGLETHALAPERIEIDATGAFEVPFALVPGRWAVQCDSHVAVDGPIELRPEDRGTQRTIRVARGVIRSVSGRVVDPDGQPLRGVHVTLRRDLLWFFWGSIAFGVTDSAGRFEIVRRFPPGTTPTGWHLSTHHRDYEEAVGARRQSTTAARWDGEPHLIRMQRHPTVEVRAVHADTGEPVRNFEVLGGFWRVGSDRTRWHRLAVSDPATGVARVVHRGRSGSRILLVRPRSPGLGFSEIRFLAPHQISGRLAFTLPPVPTRQLLVQDETGKPLYGAVVSAALSGPAGLGPALATDGQRHALGPELHHPLFERYTSRNGLIDFAVSSDHKVELHVRHAEMLDARLPLESRDSEQGPQVITLRRGSTLVGTIGPAAWRERYFRVRDELRRRESPDFDFERLRLMRAESFATRRSRSPGDLTRLNCRLEDRREGVPAAFDLEGDGTFRVTGIPPGRWVLGWDHRTTPDPLARRLSFVPIHPVITLGNGTTRRVTIDMEPFLPRTVSVSCFVNGKAQHMGFGAQLVGFARTPFGPSLLAPEHSPARDGEQMVGEALPGTYYLQVEWGVPPGWLVRVQRSAPILTTVSARIDVGPGEPAHHEFDVRIQRNIKLKLTRAEDGRPVAGAPLFRRFSEQDPGNWLASRWIDDPLGGSGPSSTVSTDEGTFPLHTLGAGTHRIYIPTRATQDSWPEGRPTWERLVRPDDPRADQLVLLGSIEVTADGQEFELEVPAGHGW